MKKILSFAAILLMLAGVMACGKENEKEIVSLKGTNWKLSGIVDVQTGMLKELEPKDCEECYTLTFLTDSTVEGLSVSYPVRFNLFHLGFYMIETIGEPFDGDKFRGTLFNSNTDSYTVTSTELKFVNNVDNYYLLFKPLEK